MLNICILIVITTTCDVSNFDIWSICRGCIIYNNDGILYSDTNIYTFAKQRTRCKKLDKYCIKKLISDSVQILYLQ